MASIRLAAIMAAALVLPACGSSTDTALQERVLQLEDEKEIRELLIAYGANLDARDYAGYAALFAKEGVSSSGFGVAVGPEAIQKILEDNLGKTEPGYINEANYHLMTTITVNVTGDTATAGSRYLVLTASEDGKPGTAIAGRYEDNLVREEGAWRFMGRTSHGVIPYRDGNAPKPSTPPQAVREMMK